MATIAEQRRDIFKAVYGVSLLGSYNKRTKKATPNSVLSNFQTDYNRYKNRGINKVLELYRNYSYAIFFMYSPSSIRNNLVSFRNVIKDSGGKYEKNAIDAFTIDNVYAPINKENLEQKRDFKAKVQSGESESQTVDPQIIVDQIKALKKELDEKTYKVANNQEEEQVRAYRILSMLGLSSGRRFTELMKTLKITKHGRKITFKGLLKGNSKEGLEAHLIGLTYKEFKTYLDELRAFAETENMSEGEVNKKYAKVFNNAMKRLGFKNVKTTRHNYSVAGSQLFKKEGESIEDTITRILGHRENFTSALNYA